MINSSPKPFQYFITQVNLLEMSQKDDLECEEVKKTKQKEKIYKYLEKQNLYIEEFPLIKTIEKMFSSSKTTDSMYLFLYGLLLINNLLYKD